MPKGRTLEELLYEINHWFSGKQIHHTYGAFQTFTPYVCQGCGKNCTHHSCSTPRYCRNCVEEFKTYLEGKGFRIERRKKMDEDSCLSK